jgi:predicted nucleotidyltransferase
MPEPLESQVALREALKRVAVALKDTGVAFALVGGYAVWARGGPEPAHDVDFVVPAEDAEKVAAQLAERGLEVEHPPEDWLFKVYSDGAMVDILFRLSGDPVERTLLEDVDCLEVESVEMPVLSATKLMVDKLNAMDEHYCDLGAILAPARAVREQVDWDEVRRGTGGNDFAAAALFLLERLGVIAAA